ncbi:hypothetical protein RHODGE_RHODGE_00895 [Rhodoplanes serenus]|uniref:Outer membrane protein beta-barrel domain-containing protein n=1 Tax=Rhodoplanes serenus TaxID=200615 RepID=A0A3S4BUS7_9BRAD|nr:outer membrane beta-barrel protein [Rhodoplanes serenus]VCU07829.1 hypothetical protein RHODGE_RHODGE_00895 [Rhodoplanes serenus]
MPRPSSRFAWLLGASLTVVVAGPHGPAMAQTAAAGTADPAGESLFAPAPAGGGFGTGFRPGSAVAPAVEGRTTFRTAAGEDAPGGTAPGGTAPGGGKATATSRPTGFDSKNTRRPGPPPPLTQRQKEAARLRAAPQPLPLVRGTNPATTPVTVPPRLTRRGAPGLDSTSRFNVPITAAIPRRGPPLPEDPYAPLGVRVGAFTLRPAIEVSTGYDSNPTRISGLPGSALTTVSPELLIRSNWQRHALDADLRGTYTWYGQTYPLVINAPGTAVSQATPEIIDRPTVDSRVRGRFDVDSLSRFEGEGRVVVSTDNPGTPNVQTGLKRFPLVTTVGATFGYTQQFNRLEVTGKTLIDHQQYQDSELLNGATLSNADREYNQYGGALRVSYELKPGLRPFVETSADTRVHSQKIDRNGFDRDSGGWAVKAGTTFEFSRKLVGEASLGWLWRVYEDPRLTTIDGLTIDAALTYTASELTTAKLIATSRAAEIIVPGLSGVFSRDVGLQVDHSFRRWLIGTAKIGTGIDDYFGSPRLDHRYYVSFAMLYKLSREIQFKTEVRHDWLRSNLPNVDWDATLVTVGVRLQR